MPQGVVIQQKEVNIGEVQAFRRTVEHMILRKISVQAHRTKANAVSLVITVLDGRYNVDVAVVRDISQSTNHCFDTAAKVAAMHQVGNIRAT